MRPCIHSLLVLGLLTSGCGVEGRQGRGAQVAHFIDAQTGECVEIRPTLYATTMDVVSKELCERRVEKR